jgi:hypothetical protein
MQEGPQALDNTTFLQILTGKYLIISLPVRHDSDPYPDSISLSSSLANSPPQETKTIIICLRLSATNQHCN